MQQRFMSICICARSFKRIDYIIEPARPRVIDQVKAYGPGHLVTADDVRAPLGVLDADGASKGFLTTTSDFAPKLPEDRLLKRYLDSQLGLVNGTQLLRRLRGCAQITSHFTFRVAVDSSARR
jgi:hypothetical protein